MTIRPKRENTFSISHNFHNVNWEHRKDDTLGYHLYDLSDSVHYVGPTVRAAIEAYKAHLLRQIGYLDKTLASNIPETVQPIIGEPDGYYAYKDEDVPPYRKNHGKFSVTIDLPGPSSIPGESIQDMIHLEYAIMIGGPRET